MLLAVPRSRAGETGGCRRLRRADADDRRGQHRARLRRTTQALPTAQPGTARQARQAVVDVRAMTDSFKQEPVGARRSIRQAIAEAYRHRSSTWWIEAALLVIAAGWCVMRCVGLGEVPAGMSTDETLSGLHVACLAETGASADGTPWPLFAKGISQGLYTPTYLYSLLVWTRIFGIWPMAIRGFSAFVTLLGIAGVGLLVRRVAGARAGRLALVAAALSPWSFQVARLAVDAPMAPMLLVWGVYLFVRSPRPAWAAAGGILLALAATTYPPLRVQVPLVTLLILFIERE